ncbi:DUF2283 domain-containing protein [Streptomyces sp.]|uniref:DUF2283 domain-containing protein n=1 Tax=Streptomyces sp. TaxID=1931 RepID=UPI002F94C1F2
MRFDHDLDADALYVTITSEPVTATHSIEDLTTVDVDAQGQLVGIEVIAPDRAWAIDRVMARYPLSDEDTRLLLSMYIRSGKQGAWT